MALRVIATVEILPPGAITPTGTKYFTDKVAFNLQESNHRAVTGLEERIAKRIESEQFGQPTPKPHPWSGTHTAEEHTGRTVGNPIHTIQIVTGSRSTPVKGLNKAEGVKVYMRNQRMPWPLLTNWPIGVPGSGLRGPFKIPRRAFSAGGREGKRRRLVFQWKNAGVTFWGRQVIHPGFGKVDVLTQELTQLREVLVAGAQVATRRAVLSWAEGGSRAKPTKSAIRRPPVIK